MNTRLLEISKALGDETRFKIISFLLDKERCVCDIIPVVKKAQPTISLQLKKLEELGLIKSRKEGKQVFFSISDEKIKKIFNLF